MKPVLRAILFASAVLLDFRILPAAAQQSRAAAEKAVLERENAWNRFYMSGNYKAMDELLAEEFLITVEDGTRYGKAGYLALVANPANKISVSEMSELKVRVSGTLAVVTGVYHTKGLSGGTAYEYRDRFTDVWVLRNGKWVLFASQDAPASK